MLPTVFSVFRFVSEQPPQLFQLGEGPPSPGNVRNVGNVRNSARVRTRARVLIVLNVLNVPPRTRARTHARMRARFYYLYYLKYLKLLKRLKRAHPRPRMLYARTPARITAKNFLHITR